MQKIALIFLIVLTGFASNAQQESLFTQFMFNKLAINPAFAGNENAYCLTGIVREHWMGFPGAPKVQALSVNFPKMARDRVGLGFSISRNSIGVQQKLSIEGSYAYRIPFENGEFSMGISVSGRQYNTDFTDPSINMAHPYFQDAAISEGKYVKNIFNAGFGLYYNNDRFYIGAGLPRMLRASIDLGESPETSFEVRHLYVMTGFAFYINPKIMFMPQVLLKAAENSPVQMDFNLGWKFYDRYFAAVTVREGGSSYVLAESLDLIGGVQLSREFFMGLAYDITITPIREFESGSVELMLNYCFGRKDKGTYIVSPRFF